MPETFSALAAAFTGAANFILSIVSKRKELEVNELKEIVGPLNDEFLKIHQSYVGMFNILGDNLRKVEREGITESLNEQDLQKRLRRILDEFYVTRRDIDGTRDTFRNKVGALLKISHDDDFRNYITALSAYIINADNDIASKNESRIISLTGRVLASMETHGEEGAGLKVFETPSTALLRNLRKASSIEEAVSIVEEGLSGLSLKQFGVLTFYFKLRVRFH